MWTFQKKSLCFCFLIFFCKKYTNAAFKQQESCTYKQSQMFYQMVGLDNTTTVHSILEFVDDHIDELKISKQEDIVFVIGAAESTKTTLISLITGAELEAIETKPCSGVFRIVDKDGPLNQYPQNVVPELIPQLLIDKERAVDYYILPNFDVATDVRRDLTAWHLVQRPLQFATGVKFMFTLSYSRKGQTKRFLKEDKQKVRQLARDANLLINDIGKYSEAISLTATNVEYDPGQSDINEIQHVANLLYETENDLRAEADTATSEESNNLNKDIEFINILTARNVSYEKIKIMRVANESGSVDDMAFLQNEKVQIMSMVRRHTKYIPRDENDFSFNISNATKDRVPELFEEMQRRVSTDILIIEKGIKNNYMQMEKEQFDLNVLSDKMREGFEQISQIKADDPRSLVHHIINAAESLKIEISSSTLDDILNHIELLYFLGSLEGQHKSKLLQIPSDLANITKYLNESTIWYDFLLDLHDKLSVYDVQQVLILYVSGAAQVMLECDINENEDKKVADTGLKFFLGLMHYTLDPAIESMTVNSFQLKKLKHVIHNTMFDSGTLFCSPKKLSVQGYNVKISDVLKMECPGDITSREIFVLNNLFIDVDVEKVGINLQLIMMAPKWEIIGNRKIILNGKNGEKHTPDNAGHNTNGVAHDGKPGNKGFSAGCFMAIGGTFENDENLVVQLIGGKGGPGQNGGAGRLGVNGQPPEYPDHSYEATSFWKRRGYDYIVIAEHEGLNLGSLYTNLISKYEVSGTKATIPTAGGNGGEGGYAGLEGKTFFVGIEQKPNFTVNSKSGN